MLRSSSAKVSIFLHTLLFLIVAASALNYWSLAEYALKESWYSDYSTRHDYISLVPVWQNGLKDLFAFLLLIGSLWFPATTPNQDLMKTKGLTTCYALSILVLGIAIARSIASNFTFIFILISLRSCLHIVALFVFCHRHLQPYYLRWVLEAINVLALIQVFYASWQRQTDIQYNSVDLLSIGAVRSVGTFINPNTMAIFLAIVFYVNLSVLPQRKWRFLILLLCGVGIFFSGSRAGLSTILMLSLIASYIKIKKIYNINFNFIKNKILSLLITIPIISIIFINTVEYVNSKGNRGDSSIQNDGRLGIFTSLIDKSDAWSLLFGHHLGFGSNILVRLNRDTPSTYGQTFISDSTFTSLLSQFGVCGLLVTLSVTFILFKKRSKIIYSNNPYLFLTLRGNINQDKTGFFIYLIGTSMTAIVFESYAILPIVISILFYFQMPEVLFYRNKF